MLKRLLVTSLALAAALTMPPAVSAQAAPDERAAAREFAYAAYRLRVKIKATEPQARRAVERLDTRACRTALGPDAEERFERLPVRAQIGVVVLVTEMELGAMYGAAGGLFPGFVAELDRVATADRTLIAGREAWRTAAPVLAQMRPVPADACAQIRRWRLAGYPADGMPALQPPPIHQLFMDAARGQEPTDAKPDRAPERAAARMVELGVPKGQAERFAGDTLFRGMPSTITMEPDDREGL